MRKYIILIIILFVNIIFIDTNAQYTDQTWTLSSTIPWGDYVARDWIELLPGFSFNNSGYTFSASIDETLVYPLDYLSTPISPDRDLNTDLTVGSLPGSFNVNLNGAASYSVPIMTPPGTKGMEPNVAVVYNSSADKGLLGYGFDLAGISCISRGPATYYYDGFYDEVDFDSDDAFYLDGNRMYSSGGNTYYTHSESYCTISSTDLDSDGSPEKFTVVTPTGTTIEYGLTSASRQIHSATGKTLQWYIEKITDANGNYISFNYIGNSNKLLISTIKYTGTTSFEPYNEVRFKYSYRNDENSFYFRGDVIQNRILLDEIVVRSEGTDVRTYTFNYIDKGIYSLLNEVVLTGSDGESLNSTVIGWQETGSNQNINLSSDDLFNTELLTGQRLVGDVNGDGKEDIFYGAENSDTLQIFLRKSDAVGFDYKGKFKTLAKGRYYLNDIDNDNKDEIIIQTMDYTQFHLNIIAYEYNESTNELDLVFNEDLGTRSHITNNDITYACEDLDGDKAKEHILCESYYGTSPDKGLKIIAYQNNWTNIDDIMTSYDEYTDPSATQSFIINFTSQLKKEIAVYLKKNTLYDEVHIYKLSGSTLSSILSWDEVDALPVFGDVNNDGIDDFIYLKTGGEIYFGDGQSFYTTTLSSPASSGSIKDFNSDGFMDICTSTTLYLSYGDGFITSSIPTGIQGKEVFDINGDGFLDILDFGNEYARIIDNSYKKPLLVSVTNGMNNQINIEYKSTAESGDFYSAPNPPGTGLIKYVEPMMCVSKVTYLPEPESLEKTEENFYEYRDAVRHLDLGFICFKSVIKSSEIHNQKTTINLNTDATYYYPYISSTLTTDYDETENIGRTDYINYKFTYNNGKSYKPYTSQVTGTDYLNDTKTIANNTYYSTKYALPQTSNVAYYNGSSGGTLVSSIETTTLYTSYTINSKTVYKPYSQTTVKTRNSQTFSQTVTYDYTNGGKNLYTVTTPLLTTTYLYNNNYGIPYRVEVTDGNETRFTQWTFDDKYRFNLTETNSLGQTITLLYDHKTGQITDQTDANNLRVSYYYDGFGNLKSSYLPNGNVIAYSQEFAKGEITGSLYKTTVQKDDLPEVTTYYNDLGNEIRSIGKNMNGQDIIKDIDYYSDGKLKGETNVYNINYNNIIWTNYSYDDYQRLYTLSTDGTNNTATYGYSGRTVSVTQSNGYNKSKTMNADGTVASITDNGGTITYSYHKSGAVSNISTSEKTVTFGYDTYGRKTSVDDQSYGYVSYEYNNFNELETQTTPTATHHMSYDLLGRPETVWTNTYSQEYTYDTRKTGQLSTISLSEGDETSTTDYYYDDLARVDSVTENHSERTFSTRYTYNNYGQVESMRYPNGFTLKYSYDNGQLRYVRRDDNTLIWEGVNQHPNGSYTQSTLGNGLTQNISYNNYNFVTGISAINTSTSTYVMNQSYAWDMLHGQLTDRSDLLNDLTESYTYDTKGRLKTFTDAQSNIDTMVYSNGGNITTKYDAGDYTYSTTKKGAVTELDGISGLDPLASEDQDIEYTDYDKASQIMQQSKKLNIYYGPGFARNRTEYRVDNNLEKTKLYAMAGLYEVEIDDEENERQLCYIMGGNGLCAVYEAEGTTENLYWIHTDHLGSINVITDENQNVVEEMSFDAWGRRRNPGNWTYSGLASSHFFDRGYTGHEQLDAFGLINMNGRMYDPLLGRFLSPDILVQDATNTQSFNSYSYCVNNPLKYFDPSGYSIPALQENPFPENDHDFYGGMGGHQWINWPKYGIGDHIMSDFEYDYLLALEYDRIAGGTANMDALRKKIERGGYNDTYGSQGPITGYEVVYNWSAKQVVLFDEETGYAYLGWEKIAEWWELVPTSASSDGGDNPWAMAAAATAVLSLDNITGVGFIDDVLIPLIWITAVVDYLSNPEYPEFVRNPVFPQDKYIYTIPDPTTPFNNPPQRPNFNPGDYETIVRWALGLTLGAKLLQNINESNNQLPFYPCEPDNTKYYHNPVIPIQF